MDKNFFDLAYGTDHCSIFDTFRDGTLNDRMCLINSFKEFMKKEFAKINVTRYIFYIDPHYHADNFTGLCKIDDKTYHFMYAYYIKALDIYPVEIVNCEDGLKVFRLSNRRARYWLQADNTFFKKDMKLRLPKHCKYHVGDYVLYKNYACKVIDVACYPKVYYTIYNELKNCNYRYKTEFYLKKIDRGI